MLEVADELWEADTLTLDDVDEVGNDDNIMQLYHLLALMPLTIDDDEGVEYVELIHLVLMEVDLVEMDINEFSQ